MTGTVYLLLPYVASYLLRQARYKVAKKAGFPQESCPTASIKTIAVGLSIAQISREIVLRGLNPKAKNATPAGAPEGDTMSR